MSIKDLIAAIAELDREDLPALMLAIAARMAEGKPTPAQAADELVDVNEAARILGVSPSWLHHRPNLPFRRKIGGKVKFSRSGIARWSQRDHHAA